MLTTPPAGAVFLLDNGSLRAASTLSLRRLAGELGERLGGVGGRVYPVSMLHSERVPAGELGGVGADCFEGLLERLVAGGEIEEVWVVPLFFGPSRGVTDLLPARARAVEKRIGRRVMLWVAPPLVDGEGGGAGAVAGLVAEHVGEVVANLPPGPGGEPPRPPVVLVDHGTPVAAVNAVRNRVAEALGRRLGGSVAGVLAASMERREGAAYDFNEPLLERVLGSPGYREGDVVVAMLFLSPGRHAGEGGDVAEICARAEAAHPGLRVHRTRLVGEHPGLVEILAERLQGLVQEPRTRSVG